MVSKMGVWVRVSKNNPCPVCGKPDWCLIGSEGDRAICQRVESSERHGEAGFLHRLTSVERPGNYGSTIELEASQGAKEFALASAARRHEVYLALLEELSLTAKHRANLASRGLSEASIEYGRYRSMPAGKCHEVVKRLQEQGLKLAGVPGFYLDKAGVVSLAGATGLLIPVLNQDFLIVGAQIRQDKPKDDSGKYIWLSSSGRQLGTGSKSPVHVAMPVELTTKEQVFLTEGALKADIIAQFSGAVAIGVPGVAMWRGALEVLTTLWPLEVILAFDNDRHSNEAVESAYNALLKGIQANHFNASVAIWPVEHKGLDDFLLTGGQIKLQQVYKASIDKQKSLSTPYKEALAKSNNFNTEAKKQVKPLSERFAELPASLAGKTWPEWPVLSLEEWRANSNQVEASRPYSYGCQARECLYAKCERKERLECEAHAWALSKFIEREAVSA